MTYQEQYAMLLQNLTSGGYMLSSTSAYQWCTTIQDVVVQFHEQHTKIFRKSIFSAHSDHGFRIDSNPLDIMKAFKDVGWLTK